MPLGAQMQCIVTIFILTKMGNKTQKRNTVTITQHFNAKKAISFINIDNGYNTDRLSQVYYQVSRQLKRQKTHHVFATIFLFLVFCVLKQRQFLFKKQESDTKEKEKLCSFHYVIKIEIGIQFRYLCRCTKKNLFFSYYSGIDSDFLVFN